MAIFATSDSFWTYWRTTDQQQKYATCVFSTSRKDKQNGEWKNSNWSFVRVVGNGFAKLADLNEKDKITNVRFSLECEPYTDKTGQRVFPKSPRMVIFDFDFAEVGRKPSGPAPVDEFDPDSSELPF